MLEKKISIVKKQKKSIFKCYAKQSTKPHNSLDYVDYWLSSTIIHD